MHLLALSILLLFALRMACTTPDAFDVLRSKVEDLSTELHQRATWRDVWSSMFPRGEYPRGAGYVRSSFKIGRSEPGTDEEAWQTIQSLSDTPQGAGNLTYNQTYVGQKEDTYKPEMFGLMGPLLNQDDLAMYWESDQFWNQYFQALEKRNARSISNRQGNVYRQYCYKAPAGSNFSFIAGDISTQPAPQAVNLSGLIAAVPDSEVTQEMLDSTAVELMQEGAQDGDTNGWITIGEAGPEFPLYIGPEMSKRIFLQNSEIRSDVNTSFMGRGDMNPVIKRMGAKRVLGNFRHVINLFPARWALVSNGQTFNYQSAGPDNSTTVTQTAAVSVSGSVATITVTTSADSSTRTFTVAASGGRCFVRIPTWCDSTAAADATKGHVAKVNGCWKDPSLAVFESCEVLNPLVMTEEIIMPVNSLPGTKLNPQNYYGEWQFVTGNDAMLGINTCTGVTDPMKKKGRHFGEYRCARKPIWSEFGRLILFKRCSNVFDVVRCS